MAEKKSMEKAVMESVFQLHLRGGALWLTVCEEFAHSP